jgi:hypothetical protein
MTRPAVPRRWIGRDAPRNVAIVAAGLVAVLYAGWYLIAFPRYGSDGRTTSRYCFADWQRVAWRPAAAVESSLRGGGFTFRVMQRSMRDHTWPNRLWP